MAAPTTPSRVLDDIATHLRDLLAAADPARVASEDAAGLVIGFTEVERLAAAGRLLFAARAAQSMVWIDEGHASAASWLAETQGSSPGEASAALEVSKQPGELERTADALRAGELSPSQAREVTRAASKDPGAEGELLTLATSDSFRHLQDRAKQVLAQASSAEEEAARYLAIKGRRYARSYTDYRGAFRLDASLTPDAGARVLAALQAEADAIFDQARQSGVHDKPDAYRADALVALLTGEARTGPHGSGTDAAGQKSGARRARRARLRTDTVTLVVDAGAFMRGWVGSGERCEIPGIGPVPVAEVRKRLPESFVKVVFTDGVDVMSVCHVGRKLSAHQQTALEVRDPACVVPGCPVTHGLEHHHYRQDYADGGTTSLDNIARVCHRHHDLITYGGYALRGGPGHWLFDPPDGDQILEDTG